MKLDIGAQGKIFVRSLLFQSVWDYERMQGLGFAWCLGPWLKRLYPKGGARLKMAWQREMGYFSTQPYMAGIVLGVAARMEESESRNPSPALEDKIIRVKKSMGAALAGIGDPLFLGAWRPLCAAAAIILAAVLPVTRRQSTGFGIAAYLILYNIPANWIRWNGIRWGYESGEQVVEKLKRLRLRQSLAHVRRIGLVLTAFLAVTAVLRAGEPGLRPMAIRGGLLLLCLGIKRLEWHALKAYAALTTLGIAVAWTLL